MTRRRRLTLFAVVAMVAVISAGCSKAPAATGPGSGGTTTGAPAAGSRAAIRDQAVKFSECMRAHGVRTFPDPDASGQLTIDGVLNGSSLDPSSAAWTQAVGACQDLEPPGFTGHKRSAQEQEAALRFARCIRDNGVKDFPDPTPDAPLIDTTRIPSLAGRDPRNAPELQTAMDKCRDLATSAGVTGG
ncbi:MAG TPA: hypothetical protein VGH94_07115 [Acidimicrobiales bacterium]|jgi:hypothetical protein